MEPLSPKARAMLDSYTRAEQPRAETLLRVKQALAGASEAPAAAGVVRAAWPLHRVIVGSVVTLAAIGGLALRPAAPKSVPREPTQVAVEPAVAPTSAALGDAAAVDSGSSLPTSEWPASGDPESAKVTHVEAPVAGAGTRVRRQLGGPSRKQEHAETASVTATAVQSPDLGASATSAEASPSAPPAASAPIARALPSDKRAQGIDAEVMQVRTAYDLLKAHQPLRALSALGEHARRFPDGKLGEVAALARMLALCDLDRSNEARQLADRFLREHADSVHAARVRSVCTR